MDQRFEYKTAVWGNKSWGKSEDVEAKLNDLAEEGWQLVETIVIGGSTKQFLLERPVE